MIVAYAQAAARQGIDAALNGVLVAANEPTFALLREKAVTLNLEGTPDTSGLAEVSCGRGVVRLELLGAEDGAANLSPIVVVAEVADLLQHRAEALQLALQSVARIGREVDAAAVANGFEAGERLYHSARTRRRVAAVVALALIAATIVWIARGCAAPGGS